MMRTAKRIATWAAIVSISMAWTACEKRSESPENAEGGVGPVAGFVKKSGGFLKLGALKSKLPKPRIRLPDISRLWS